MNILREQKLRASITTYLCILMSILFALPVSSQRMDFILRIISALIIVGAYIGFIIYEKPGKKVIISASIPSIGWAVLEFIWHAWMIKSGMEKWKGGFMITIGGPAEVPVETFVLLSMIIIQSYFIAGCKGLKKVMSYVALTGFIFGTASYYLQLFGLMEGSLIIRGMTVNSLSAPFNTVTIIAATMLVCVVLYYIFYLILSLYNKLFESVRERT